jgi:hypothetical protein
LGFKDPISSVNYVDNCEEIIPVAGDQSLFQMNFSKTTTLVILKKPVLNTLKWKAIAVLTTQTQSS